MIMGQSQASFELRNTVNFSLFLAYRREKYYPQHVEGII
jgi:hypothetical protein